MLAACARSAKESDKAPASQPAATKTDAAARSLEGALEKAATATPGVAVPAPQPIGQPKATSPAPAATTAPAAGEPPSPDDLLLRQFDWATKRLEGLNLAKALINDQELNTLVDQFSGKLDELTAKMSALDAAAPDAKEAIRKDTAALVAELKALDSKINERVKAIKQ
jgi:hypothetical protein